MDGVQSNKTAETFYKRLEDSSGNLDLAQRRFDETMSYLGALYPPQELANTNWSRVHLFYTLFTSVAHLLFGVKRLKEVRTNRGLRDSVARLRVRLDDVSSDFDTFTADLKQPPSVPDWVLPG
jgi:hypothetical protein